MRRKFSAGVGDLGRERHRYFRGRAGRLHRCCRHQPRARVIAVNLDVGTDNEALLNDRPIWATAMPARERRSLR